MKMRIRQRGSFEKVAPRMLRAVLFTPAFFAPFIFVATEPFGAAWWMLLWMVPLSWGAAFLGVYSLHEALGFWRGYYFFQSKTNAISVRNQGGLWFETFKVPLRSSSVPEWNEIKQRLQFPDGGIVFCEYSDAEKVIHWIESLVESTENYEKP